MISCHQLTVAEPTGEKPLFDGASFEIDKGEWAEIVGASGTGKSLLRAFLALEARPKRGDLVVVGRNLERIEPGEMPQLRRQIGCCRQPPELLGHRTVLENLILPLVIRGETDAAARRGEELLGRADFGSRAQMEASKLSEGRRWLLGVLRAAIGAPSLVVVDGALEALDSPERDDALEVLERVHDRGSTVVLFGREATAREAPEGPRFRIDGGLVQRTEP